jgi:hypothetical protein
MASSRTRPQHTLSDFQLDTLVKIVVENFGLNINRQTFTDAALALFEDIAGFETLTQRATAHYVRRLWLKYQAREHQRALSFAHRAGSGSLNSRPSLARTRSC